MLADADHVRAGLVARSGRSTPTRKVARRLMSATAVIVEVLRTSDEPLGIAEVLSRVEQSLERSVKRASLKASPAGMASSDASPVRRVGRGRCN